MTRLSPIGQIDTCLRPVEPLVDPFRITIVREDWLNGVEWREGGRITGGRDRKVYRRKGLRP